MYIIDVDITTLCVEGTITPTEYTATNTVSSSIAFNIMNELLRKECDVSCNFIFLSNCMTKWFLHSLGIIYWRGFELRLLSFFFCSAVLLLQMPLRCSHHHLWSVGLVYRHTLEWFKDNLINENQDGLRLFHIYCMWVAGVLSSLYIHPVGLITLKSLKKIKENGSVLVFCEHEQWETK